jgi:hypothetical protein
MPAITSDRNETLLCIGDVSDFQYPQMFITISILMFRPDYRDVQAVHKAGVGD